MTTCIAMLYNAMGSSLSGDNVGLVVVEYAYANEAER